MTAHRHTSTADEGLDPVSDWANDVLSGNVIAGPHIRNACRRHLLDLEFGGERGIHYDRAAANRAINFFPDVLRLAGGQFEGRPFELHPSQKFRVGSLFGWKRDDGTRRFRRFYDEEGKGNGKSPLMAGIGMYCLVADGEARAEVYAAGSKKDQAMVLFRDAVAMREQSPALKKRLTTSGVNPVWNLADMRTGSFFRPISSEDGQSGPRPHCALCDEIHEHKTSTMIELLERGFKWRRQPLLAMATNAGTDRQSACWTEHQHAIRVAAGTKELDEDFTFVGEPIDDTTFAFVCSLDKNDDPLEDPTCWPKANPLLDTIVTEEYLWGVVKQGKQIPGKLNNILRLHFCIWTDAETAWMSRRTFEACLASFDPETLHAGRDLYVGADLSASQDMTALGFVVPTGTVEVEREVKKGPVVERVRLTLPTYDAWVEAWTPKDTLAERALRDEAPYELWVKEGYLHAPPGKLVRMDFVAAHIASIAASFQVKALGYDRYAFRKNFEPLLDEMGLDFEIVEHPQGGKRRAAPSENQVEAAEQMPDEEKPQGLWMPGSINELEAAILEGRIRFRRSPVLISAVMSATIEMDPFANRWFSKRKAVNRIDALVALTMAVGVAESFCRWPSAAPYYERHGLAVL